MSHVSAGTTAEDNAKFQGPGFDLRATKAGRGSLCQYVTSVQVEIKTYIKDEILLNEVLNTIRLFMTSCYD